jgi:heme A synthase
MSTSSLATAVSPRWLHTLAVVTVCAAFAPLALGTLVTTNKVGMADPDWPTYPWHLLLLDWKQYPAGGFIIEHSHRAAGWLIGFLAIALALCLWLKHARRWVGWFGILAMAAVGVQGVLGGLRVRLNEWLPFLPLDTIHGCFAQLVFGMFVSLALFTSRGWITAEAPSDTDSRKLRRWSLLTCILIYAQLVFGGIIRHSNSTLAQRGHLLLAFAVVAAVIWLAKLASKEQTGNAVRRTLRLLGVLVALQILFGVETWMTKYKPGVLPELQRATLGQAMIVMIHFLFGSAIFATAVVLTLRTHRQASLAVQVAPAPVHHLEGVA